MATKLLTERELTKALAKLSGWSINKKHTELTKRHPVESFLDGLALSARIAVHAEILGHHPELTLSPHAVTVVLTTHDVKGLSKLDIELAERIDRLSRPRT